jgi:hypothetical protein
MNSTTNAAPVVRSLPNVDVPVERVEPRTDPLRDAPEVVRAIGTDSRIAPADYLDEVLVPGGGE